MADVDPSPAGRGPVDQQDAPTGDTRRRHVLHGVAAALVGAFLICLPTLLTWDIVAEWSGVILLLRTLLTAVLVLVTGGILFAVGRTRPAAAAIGKGALAGVALGLVTFMVVTMTFPQTPVPDPMKVRPTTADRPVLQR